MKTLIRILLLFSFGIVLSVCVAFADSIEKNQQYLTIYPNDQKPSISSEEEGSAYELLRDAHITAEKQDRDELDPSIVRSRYVQVSLDYLKESETIIINLFDDVSVTAIRNRVEERSESRFTWFGRVTGKGLGYVILTVENGDMVGHIDINGRLYNVMPVGKGIHAVREIDQCAFPPDAPSRIPPEDGEPGSGIVPGLQHRSGLSSDDGSIIDVMVIYTDDVAKASSNIGAEIQNAIDQTNQSYENSFITQRLRLVHKAEVNYAETSNSDTDLDCIKYKAGDCMKYDPYPNCVQYADACLDQIHTWRDTYHADVVSFWVKNMDDYCGLGYIMLSLGHWFEAYAFSVVKRSCVSNNTFAHELGHNMGADHDVEASFPGPGIFPYSSGFIWKDWYDLVHVLKMGKRTIMAYPDGCSSAAYLWGELCDRVLYWSTPNIEFRVCWDMWPFPDHCHDYHPIGSADEDNVRTLNETAFTVANFRLSNQPPVCDADGPYFAECTGATTEIKLDGTGSSDPNPGDSLAYAWSSSCPDGSFDDSTSPTPLLSVNSSLGVTVVCNANLTVTDREGLSDSCSSIVTIDDTLPPSITCPSDTVIECTDSSDPSNTGSASAIDACDPNPPAITFSDSVTPGTCPQEKTIKRTWTATDVNGYSSSCVQTIEVVDTTPPEIACPADITVECDESTAPSNTGSATATDKCDSSPVISYSDVEIPGSCPQEKTIKRTWTATDACGNFSTCVQTINVVDTTAPVLKCNAPRTIRPPDAPISFMATATDNCDDDPSIEITGFDCFKFTKKGKRIDKKESCVIDVVGDTVTILDTGGVGTRITWTTRAIDGCGNVVESECGVEVVKPGKRGKKIGRKGGRSRQK